MTGIDHTRVEATLHERMLAVGGMARTQMRVKAERGPLRLCELERDCQRHCTQSSEQLALLWVAGERKESERRRRRAASAEKRTRDLGKMI